MVSNNQFYDQTHDPTLVPTQFQNYDFYQYGGLLRAVTLHTLPQSGPSINRIEVLPRADNLTGKPNGIVDIAVYFDNAPAAGSLQTLGLAWDDDTGGGAAPDYTSALVHAGGFALLGDVLVPKWRMWEPVGMPTKAPQLALHTLTVGICRGERDPAVSDAVTVRFGLRTLATRGRDILLNGKPLKLKGVNRHDMFPGLGPVLPASQYVADLDLLQLTLHGNFIRGCHYPQDDRFLDLCDERGVIVWNEALAWGNYAGPGVGTLTDPLFMAAELGTAKAMIDSGINHPSIALWGFFNEGQSDSAIAVPSYVAMAKAFRARDPSRLITWASNRKKRDLALAHADVISFNDYPGWYGGATDKVDVAASWRDNAAWVAENWPGKPFIISETGAGAIFGNHSTAAKTNPEQARWSEEYQQVVDGFDAGEAMSNANISGLALWQFTDMKVDAANSSTNRPGGINNKGIFSRWRKPKLAMQTVADAFSSAESALGNPNPKP